MFHYVVGVEVSTLFCVTSGFRRDVHEICDHLGFYTASSGKTISHIPFMCYKIRLHV